MPDWDGCCWSLAWPSPEWALFGFLHHQYRGFLLLVEFTFRVVDNPLSRALGSGLTFFAISLTALIWSAGRIATRTAQPSEKRIG
jgi:hypothetical protein